MLMTFNLLKKSAPEMPLFHFQKIYPNLEFMRKTTCRLINSIDGCSNGVTPHIVIHCRSSGSVNLEFNLREITESTATKSSKKNGRQFDSRFGIGDTVTVEARKKTTAENKVSSQRLLS